MVLLPAESDALATAFAAEGRDGDTAKGVPLHRLSKVLARAHVPGAVPRVDGLSLL